VQDLVLFQSDGFADIQLGLNSFTGEERLSQRDAKGAGWRSAGTRVLFSVFGGPVLFTTG